MSNSSNNSLVHAYYSLINDPAMRHTADVIGRSRFKEINILDTLWTLSDTTS
jgi:hypothetical protein